MTTYPTLTDGDPEARNVGAWNLDDMLETAETLAVWHEDQHAAAMQRCDSSAVVEHQVAADLIRELMDRVPPFPLEYRTPRTGSEAGRTVVEIAGCVIERAGDGPVVYTHGAGEGGRNFLAAPSRLPRRILEACERAHDRSEP